MDASKAEITRIKSELSPLEVCNTCKFTTIEKKDGFIHLRTQERLQELNDMYEQVTTLERRIGKFLSWCVCDRFTPPPFLPPVHGPLAGSSLD